MDYWRKVLSSYSFDTKMVVSGAGIQYNLQRILWHSCILSESLFFPIWEVFSFSAMAVWSMKWLLKFCYTKTCTHCWVVFQIRMCFMHSFKVCVWSSVLYAGCAPHVHVLALIAAQQLDMQAHKAGRKLFLEESAIALVCCTAWATSAGCLQCMRRNPLLMQRAWTEV